MVHFDVASASMLPRERLLLTTKLKLKMNSMVFPRVETVPAREDSTRLRASLIRDETAHKKLNAKLTEHKVRHDKPGSRSGTLHGISLGVDEVVDDTDR
jgi:hypothetical protein